MAVTSLERVVFLKTLPLPACQVESMLGKFFRCTNGTGNLAPDFLARLYLAYDLVGPLVRHVTVRATGANTRAITVVDATGVGRVNIVLHLVAANTELLGIGHFHGPVKSNHVGHAGEEKECGNDTGRNTTPASQ